MTTVATTWITDAILSWYARNARDLPWRRAHVSPWAVLVSEVMLQQTPVSRVLPAYESWLARWPTPAAMARESPGEAVRQWGRLGYPRRALRLHAAARAMVSDHGGEVPPSYPELRELPGIGDYTAAAVAAFAFGRRHTVMDTNVRRVLARLDRGTQYPPRSVTAADRRLGESYLPEDPSTAAQWSVGVMELGALVCTARSPHCDLCPLAGRCRWRLAGRPEAAEGDRPRAQRYTGTDRHVRGRLLALLRESGEPVSSEHLATAWDEPARRDRALRALAADGLVEVRPDGRYALPG